MFNVVLHLHFRYIKKKHLHHKCVHENTMDSVCHFHQIGRGFFQFNHISKVSFYLFIYLFLFVPHNETVLYDY